MLGAIIGDIVGSTREWHNIKTEDFELVPDGSRFTDDTVMTLAVAQWLLTDETHKKETLIECMQRLGRRYPWAGYGSNFYTWLFETDPKPYGSFGNGSAMRVSPVGLYAKSIDEALELARTSAVVSHNHHEGIKGAQAVAACVFMRKQGKTTADIKEYVEKEFGYDLGTPLESIRPGYTFHVSCQGSVPIAIMAFLQREGKAEEALRLAISMGGDSDTIGCMTCSIATARAYIDENYRMPKEVEDKCRALMPADLLEINDDFEAFLRQRDCLIETDGSAANGGETEPARM
ncbi:MAG: ADP-ribosylglycohydrolase family protein [Prevotella sp.]|nr:ADP-ribosylglycohydrolase family protein [Prevotella sp.]